MGQRTEEQLTTDIEHTREDLSRNLDALNDRVNPGRVLDRRKEAARNRLGSMKDKVMGSAQHAEHRMSSAGESMSGSARGAASTVQQKAEGNPLAAGLIAFGAGMLVSSMIPASQKESQAAQRLVESAKEHGQPVLDEAKSAGQQMGENLKEQASEAAQQVKDSAQESAQQVRQEGQSSAQHVKDEGTQRG
jgi:ElaB/YqjD/DUF883 family membrane-anchored ribosome-binding protein